MGQYKQKRVAKAVKHYHTEQLVKTFTNWQTRFNIDLDSEDEYIMFRGSRKYFRFEARGVMIGSGGCYRDIHYLYAWKFYYKGDRIFQTKDIEFDDEYVIKDYIKGECEPLNVLTKFLDSARAKLRLEGIDVERKAFEKLKEIKALSCDRLFDKKDTDTHDLIRVLENYL